MSSYDENGNGGGYRPTYAAIGKECANCYRKIDRVKHDRLYYYGGEYLCEDCSIEAFESHKYAQKGFCDQCTEGYEEDLKAEWFTPVTVVPWGIKLLCVDCIIERLNSIREDDPIEE